MGTGRRLAAATLVAGLSFGLAGTWSPAVGQEEPARPKLVDWAPQWRRGAWWTVRLYQRDQRERIASPNPAEGGMPVPQDPARDALPGYPPLRDGVPVGWKRGNVFRFEVERRELVRWDDEEGVAPEPFLVVAVRTTEGSPARTAELWIAQEDLTLGRVVLEPKTPRQRVIDTAGTVQLEPAALAGLGFPLVWPDFRAERDERKDIVVEGVGRFEQKVRIVNAGTPTEEAHVQLAELAKDPDDPPLRRARIAWRKGQPFWSRLVTPEYLGELLEVGK